ncbi:MAG: hypothetical protein JNG89_18625, partial [Planctomycetaceae bacterium]|nr:hypothetical protein [Planctomycetaceae bacterium]
MKRTSRCASGFGRLGSLVGTGRVAALLLVACVGTQVAAQPPAEPAPMEVESIRQQLLDAQSRWGREWGLRLLIQPGVESEAQAYYGRISTV